MDYISSRGLELISDTTDLGSHQFVLNDIVFKKERNGEIPKGQQVSVTYANSFVLTSAITDKKGTNSFGIKIAFINSRRRCR